MSNYLPFWPEWEVQEKLGQGSYGAVYKIRKRVSASEGTEIFSALKVLHIPLNDSEIKNYQSQGIDTASIKTILQEEVSALENEIRVMISLASAAGIVTIEDYHIQKQQNRIGWDLFIRMELLESLSDYVERNNGISVEEVLKLGCDLCDALTACESRNIIHRDIKPANIFRNSFGQFKLGDFGVAKQMEGTRSAATRVGTPNFEAPEVYSGKKYDNTVDIYGLGVVLYTYLNNGRKPFYPPYPETITRNTMQEAFERRMNGEPVPPIKIIDRKLSAIIEKACAFQPSKRYQKAAQMKADLEEYKYLTNRKQIYKEPEKSNILGGEQAILLKSQKSSHGIAIGIGIVGAIVVGTAGIFLGRMSERNSKPKDEVEISRVITPTSEPTNTPLPTQTPGPTSTQAPTPTLEPIYITTPSVIQESTSTPIPELSASDMNDLGNRYYYGDGVNQDYEKAFEWYEKAAKAGSSDAMTDLGYMYQTGVGINQDYKKAIEWYEKAAEAGEKVALYDLGYMYENGYGVEQDYKKAFDCYEKAAEAGYLDAKEALERMQEDGLLSEQDSDNLANVSVGDVITFGTYEQDNDLSNGKEEIEWIVLEKEEDRVLVISKYGLDAQPYNTGMKGVTWNTCTLRKWLNSTFLDEAFTEAEQSLIPTVTLLNADNPEYGTAGGNDTEDKVFLLSIEETEQYFDTDESRECQTTAYAKEQGAYTGSSSEICWWWLRSPGDYSDSAAGVFDAGSVDFDGSSVYRDNGGVRPALWINL